MRRRTIFVCVALAFLIVVEFMGIANVGSFFYTTDSDVDAKSGKRRCANMTHWNNPNCTCEGAWLGALCGPGLGKERCQGECNHGFAPLPTGFPRSYVVADTPRTPEMVPWDPETMFNSNLLELPGDREVSGIGWSGTAKKFKLPRLQRDPSLRQRWKDGAELQIYCNTLNYMGVSNQDLTLAACLLLAYKLNASTVVMAPLYHQGHALFNEVWDLEVLQSNALRYGINVVMANALPSCVSEVDRANDHDLGLGKKHYSKCCGLGQVPLVGASDGFDILHFTAAELTKYELQGVDLLRYQRVEETIHALATRGTIAPTFANFNCGENPIFLQAYGIVFTSYNIFRTGWLLPTSDWLVPSKLVREVVAEAKQNIAEGVLGLANSGPEHGSKVAPPPQIQPHADSQSSCNYLGVHFRSEKAIASIWNMKDMLDDEKQMNILRQIDHLAVELNCPKVVMTNQPFGLTKKQRSLHENIFFEEAQAKWIMAGTQENGAAVPRRGPNLARQLSDRSMVADASVAVIYDPFVGLSSFSQRLYDLRCRASVPAMRTFSYMLPFTGQLTPEC